MYTYVCHTYISVYIIYLTLAIFIIYKNRTAISHVYNSHKEKLQVGKCVKVQWAYILCIDVVSARQGLCTWVDPKEVSAAATLSRSLYPGHCALLGGTTRYTTQFQVKRICWLSSTFTRRAAALAPLHSRHTNLRSCKLPHGCSKPTSSKQHGQPRYLDNKYTIT